MGIAPAYSENHRFIRMVWKNARQKRMGRRKVRWRDNILIDQSTLEIDTNTQKKLAKDRQRWRQIVQVATDHKAVAFKSNSSM